MADENEKKPIFGVGANLHLGRAEMYLEKGEFANAKEYYEKVLEVDPSNPQAFLGLLLIEKGVKTPIELKGRDIVTSENYQNLVRFGGTNLIPEEVRNIELVKPEDKEKHNKYLDALKIMNSARQANDYKRAADIFVTIKDYKDSSKLFNDCTKQASETEKFAVYKEAKMKMNSSNEELLIAAINGFDSISGWSDADALKLQAQKNLDAIREARKNEVSLLAKQKRKEITIICIAIPAVIAVIAGIVCGILYVKPQMAYKKAEELKNNMQFIAAAESFRALGDYKDSVEQVNYCKFQYGQMLANEEKYEEAINIFYSLGNYNDAYNRALELANLKAVKEENNTANAQVESLKNASVGDTVTVGDYTWTVMAKEDGKVLILSNTDVTYMPYNDSFQTVDWESCSLRTWLNNDFYASFTTPIQNRITTTTLDNPDNITYATSGGNSTEDKIFLFSYKDAVDYFDNVGARAIDGWWWLRTPGEFASFAARVANDGQIYLDGDYVSAACGVRPAMWVDVK